jgi:hypothetical protein
MADDTPIVAGAPTNADEPEQSPIAGNAAADAKQEDAARDVPVAATTPADETSTEVSATPAVPEPPKELEEDAKADTRARLVQEVVFFHNDMTMNIMPSVHGNVLVPLTDGGVQYLLAGARANVGIKAGRYMFEAKMVETSRSEDGPRDHRTSRLPAVKTVFKVGFATGDSSLFLGDSEHSVCFDSEGTLVHNRKASPCCARISHDQVIGVLLNLDADSPNANTVSLFQDGVRLCQPQPLPESLVGKTLFPAITFRAVTVQVNFGIAPMAKLPFVCRMVQDATISDVTPARDVRPKDGKYEVLFPVCLPDEGTFDWLDDFLENNPHYTELSDRMLLDWAERSGIQKPRTYTGSLDKPDFHFGAFQLDNPENCLRRIITQVCPFLQCHFVVMEVKGNLQTNYRIEIAKRFGAHHFKRVATVIVGEPDAKFKARNHAIILKEKQAQADVEFRATKHKERQQLVVKKRELEMEQAKRDAARAAKKAKKAATALADDMLKEAAKEASAATDGESKSEEAGTNVEDAAKEELPKDAKDTAKKEAEGDNEEDDADEPMEEIVIPDEADEVPPPVTLTDEEKKNNFVKHMVPDLAPHVLGASFAGFTLPTKDEGFDQVNYDWVKEAPAKKYVNEWILSRKITTRIEDIQPSEWFKQQWCNWQAQLHRWHMKLNEWKDPARRIATAEAKEAKVILPPSSEAPEAANTEAVEGAAEAQKAATDEKKTEEKKAEASEDTAEAQNAATDEQKIDEKKQEETPKAETDEKKTEEKKTEDKKDEFDADVQLEDFDVFGVTDVCNINSTGEPLFSNFAFEDWALLSLRYELHLLVHAFRRDAADADRKGVHQDNLPFYYNRYFKKAFNTKFYGVETYDALVEFIRDTIDIEPKLSILESNLSDDHDGFDVFVKLTEESRRERQLRLDAGENIPPMNFSKPPQPGSGPPGGGGVTGGGRSYTQHDRYRSDPYKGGKGPLGGKGGGGCYGQPKGGFYAPPQQAVYGHPAAQVGVYGGKGDFKGGYGTDKGCSGKGGYAGGKGGYPPCPSGYQTQQGGYQSHQGGYQANPSSYQSNPWQGGYHSSPADYQSNQKGGYQMNQKGGYQQYGGGNRYGR